MTNIKKLLEDRTDHYGPFKQNSEDITMIFNILTGQNLEPKHYAIFMLIVKLVRDEYKEKQDNKDDMEGYIRLWKDMTRA